MQILTRVFFNFNMNDKKSYKVTFRNGRDLKLSWQFLFEFCCGQDILMRRYTQILARAIFDFSMGDMNVVKFLFRNGKDLKLAIFPFEFCCGEDTSMYGQDLFMFTLKH